MINRQYDIRISGRGNLAKFLTKVKTSGAKISLLTVTDGVARISTDKKGIKEVRKYRRRYGLKVNIFPTGKDSGLIALFSSYRYIIVFVIPLIGSFFLWSIHVEPMFQKLPNALKQNLNRHRLFCFGHLHLFPGKMKLVEI